MDCEKIKELLDAYALGAAEPDEAIALEDHVADCVRCWSSLDEAQQAAATIALSTSLHRAPESLRKRILAESQRLDRLGGPSLRDRLRRLWPAGIAVLAAGATASLALALFLQTQVSDLRDDNDQLAAEVESASARLTEQQQVMAVLAAPDTQQIALEPTDPTSHAGAIYHWSGSAQSGALVCNNLPNLQAGQVYQVWFLTGFSSYAAGSFEAWDGIGQLGMDLEGIPEHPDAIVVAIEDAGGADEPGDMILFAEFQR
jgi:hypothetical protein